MIGIAQNLRKTKDLKELFMYYYGMKKGELNGKKKAELVTLLADKVTSEDSNTTLWLHHDYGERIGSRKGC